MRSWSLHVHAKHDIQISIPMKSNYLNTAGLEMDQSVQSFLYNLDIPSLRLAENAIVPLHYQFNFAEHRPRKNNFRYDYFMYYQKHKLENEFLPLF